MLRLSAYLLELPLEFPVEHTLAHARATHSLLVRLEDGRGLSGYGEGVPRVYVTGETLEHSLAFLRRQVGPRLRRSQPAPGEELGWLAQGLEPALLDAAPAAACAVETALLDLAGRRDGRPLAEALGGVRQEELVYSAVVPYLPLAATRSLLERARALGLERVKLKVGFGDDAERLALVREVLGSRARLRVDANGQWTSAEAVERIRAMAPYRVEAVEQPVPAADLEGLARVTREVEPTIVADESLTSPASAAELMDRGAAGCLNLRLSKCGGPWRTRQIWLAARQHGVSCMLGCHVGELGVLSALGRAWAACHPGLEYLEGSLTRFYVGGDIISEDLSFGRGGVARPLSGAGLGVTVLAEHLPGPLLVVEPE
jgi:muconate cycloisomerase